MLLLKSGHVIDPRDQIDRIADVLIDDGKILRIGKVEEQVDNVIDASGCYVTPGLIDHHCHLYPLAKIGLPAEAVCFASGVTTAVDAGSTGCATYALHRPFIQQSKLRIKAYLNVCTTGLSSLPTLEDVDPDHWDEGAIRDCFDRYGGELLGLKLRTSAPIVRELGYQPLRATVALAEKLGVTVMVHCTNPPGEMSELLDILRPGDVMTHMYMNQGSAITENGVVKECAYRARERGVVFEAADARAHFGLDVAQAAIQEGFWPDILASDLTKLSMHLRPTAFNMAMQLSKYAALGIPFKTLIGLCTVAPAAHMGMADTIGSLTVGHGADIAVFRPVNRENIFGDRPYGNKDQKQILGETVYQPVLTLKDGDMVYRDITF